LLTKNLAPDIEPVPATVPPRLRAALTTVLLADLQRRPRLGALSWALKEAARESSPVTAAAVTARHPAPIVLTDIRRSRRRRRALVPGLTAALVAVLIGAIIAFTRDHGRSTTAITADTTAPPARVTATATPVSPVTASPTTASPATAPLTAAPSTATGTTPPAPTTAAATVPTAAPPAAPTTAAAPPADRARLAESFLRTYYSTVAARHYEQAWSMLTPEFQATTGGYSDYISFWDTIERIEILQVEVDPVPGGSTWPIVATLGMRYTVDGRIVDENDQLTLAPDSTGAPRISGYRVIGHA
jgi:hypothetical protein